MAAATPLEQNEAQQTSARRIDAFGPFTAVVDLSSLVVRDVGSQRCEFRVQGTLIFEGTLDGEANGTTTALIFAPCAQATEVPPGTYKDVFRFEGSYSGTVDGIPAIGRLSYTGITRRGGAIEASIRLHADTAKAVLHTVDARVLVGGTYRGVALTSG